MKDNYQVWLFKDTEDTHQVWLLMDMEYLYTQAWLHKKAAAAAAAAATRWPNIRADIKKAWGFTFNRHPSSYLSQKYWQLYKVTIGTVQSVRAVN
jgi:hypothetical protein